MREIKFRAWDKGIKVMRGFEWIKDIPQRAFWTADDLEIMQYTGLKDKNGKEIYEGDLLKISMQGDEQTNPFEVENMWDLRIGMNNNDPYMRIDSDCEIIGNIYENPKLLPTRS